MAELADIVVHSKNKLTLQHETKLFVPNIPYSIKVPSQGGVCGRECLNSTPVSPAVARLIETVWHRFSVKQVSK